MAYKDCADFLDHLAKNMPKEVDFVAPQFREIATTFRRKIGLMNEFVKDGTEQ